MDLVLDGDGCAAWGAHVFRAALGRAGVARAKREGDHATPVGKFLLREKRFPGLAAAEPNASN